MEANIVRIAVTVIGFACFIGICLWAFSKHARKGFDEAAMLPFTEDDDKPASREDGQSKQGKEHG